LSAIVHVEELDGQLSAVDVAACFDDWPRPCLLHSAAPGHPLSRFSYFSADPVATISAPATAWEAAATRIRGTFEPHLFRSDLPPFQGGWMGWLSYELGSAFDRIKRHPHEPQAVPDIALALHDWVIAWDHHAGRTWLISTGVDSGERRDAARAVHRARQVLARLGNAAELPVTKREGPASGLRPVADVSESEYRNLVAQAVELILDGDLFQVNLSQRFTARYHDSPLSLYRSLCATSAAPMAAYIRHDNLAVASASPEEFLRFDPRTRRVETRPIKGTRPRHADPLRDAALAAALERSAKDRAENVMIVDLLRNDLSRLAVPGSVTVPALCELESHPTVHHLVSVVRAQLRPDADALDLLAATVPGGSITGAPKLRAMEVIAALEPTARGVYSGVIGWIGLDGALGTSIAIRTIVLHDDDATFHAGGGITARSDPGSEYDETLDKARALIAALGSPS
jgi:para-aminobenzoate synthetase component 1